MAYGLRQGGQDETTLAFRNTDTRQDLADLLSAARYFSASIKHDLSGVYYVKMLKEGPRVYYHAMGSDPARDSIVFGESFGPTYSIGCDIGPESGSNAARWLICQV